LIHLLCFTQIGAQIHLGERFKYRALSLSTGPRAVTFSVRSVTSSANWRDALPSLNPVPYQNRSSSTLAPPLILTCTA
jgi:hypothetical protein